MNKEDKQALDLIFTDFFMYIEQVKIAIEIQEERLNKIEKEIKKLKNCLSYKEDKFSYNDEV